ncbi:TetR/AcrR family transcriptional regulator [Paractinoplanes atraurantiacus]|uniref:DNA-binding transcriptional regulator, AcrR family n=1 Tax=Paractinoplanes atraurantiacus TaxID=1036182 RepID=A0A285HN78_9ACTN|nr:TetR/AcrR family transcriptional regulator [Actinoplanes atraurantiacus]SNY37053.1 DNA-binding transcriptional regulator, AcrR family [Actinoplanes atraurantiacus]
MTPQTRRQRERAEREQLIITAARELAEAEGWEAVTTRRLAERVEYSQPVLYSHFAGKDAIMAAVALEGFTELAAQMRAAREHSADPLAGVSAAYIDFAEQRPALYDAMFSRSLTLPFATPETPAAMQACFEELLHVVRPIAATDDEGLLAELLWSALHGLATLTAGGRLPRELHDRRLALLLARLST